VVCNHWCEWMVSVVKSNMNFSVRAIFSIYAHPIVNKE
jgi:hypothetical protein